MTDPKHNNPPDPIDEATAPYADAIEEAGNWADGTLVENEGQMKAVDTLIKGVKAAKKSVVDAEKSAAAPLHDAWKAEKALWKPTIDDLEQMVKCLLAAVGPFKQKLADEKAAKVKAEWEAANELQREAEEKARQASASDIEAQREAGAAKQAAMDADKSARAASKDTVKGMRKVHKYEIEDYRAAHHDIAKNHKAEMTAFIDDFVRRNHKTKEIAGVKTWVEKESF